MVRLHPVRAVLALALLTGGLNAPAQAAPGEPQIAEEAAGALVRGEVQQAVQSYTEALKDTALPNDRRAAILNDRGVANIKLGLTRQAFEDFNLAAQLFPEFAAVYNNRGNLLLSLGLAKEAVKDFDRSIVLAPGYAAAYNNRAGAYVRLGELDDAIADYTKAIQLLPSNPAPLSGRGLAHLALLRPHAAIRDFTRSVKADARFAAGYRNRAEAKLEVEHYDEAIEDLSRAIAFDVSHAESYVLRGKAYLATRNTASAIKDFTKAIEIDPKNAIAYAERGFAFGLAEAQDDSFGDLNRAIEIDPRSGLAFAYRAYAYKQAGQIDVALRDIEVAQKLNPETAEVYWVKAEIEEAQGQTEQAIADLKKAQTLRPGYRDATESLQRLGSVPSRAEDTVVADAGIDTWRVVSRGQRFVAINDLYPRLAIPLEMMGSGQPKLLEWELKQPPFKGIGTLRFFGGSVTTKTGTEDLEQVAVVDVEAGVVVAIEPHKQGEKVATWTWENGKVTVASVDGVTDEFALRADRPEMAGQGLAGDRRFTSTSQTGGWAPWDTPFGGAFGQQQPPPAKRATVKKKPKTIFDLLFN
ncbi:MAG: tetratricopeptide repeat protein [Hyphomicrobium zavarzinii]|uniref:tetratricopeptide repeat protein n=1 Tax=Hyphomicrobium zavarzinii TaxID=48292 RepID=UPI001A5894D6|nr:tetratricopeptide repeat protein [Hyphomicrobium zavarzinii]MBL8845386.1 tetratricopeptide repeat protein [Hyphomicrobium zavarzinii]